MAALLAKKKELLDKSKNKDKIEKLLAKKKKQKEKELQISQDNMDKVRQIQEKKVIKGPEDLKKK